MALIVQKFGGTSVKDTDRIKNVASRVGKYRLRGDQVVTVVSAMGGMTDQLVALTSVPEGAGEVQSMLNDIGQRYIDTSTTLLSSDGLAELLEAWRSDAEIITKLLGAPAIDEPIQESGVIVTGFGELWSARLLAMFLTERKNLKG